MIRPASGMPGRPRTLLVGWDAACWSYLRPLLDDARLPILDSLIQAGTSGTLHSTMPPWTPTAWSTIVTGTNPGKHGIFDMLTRAPGGGFTPINATHRRGAPFWDYLNQAGVRTGLVNVPFSYPPSPLEGFLVCGFGTPGSISRLTYPDEATDRIRSIRPDFKPEVDPKILRSSPPEEIFRVERNQQESFVEIAAVLSGDIPVDVLVINLMFPDHANHKMPEIAQVEAAYVETDAHLGRLIEAFAPQNVMLISDHGSSRLSGDFWLGAWLQDEGYLVETENDPDARAAALNWLLLQRYAEGAGQPALLEKLLRWLHRQGLMHAPGFIRRRLWERLEAEYPDAARFVRLSGEVDTGRSALIPGSVYAGVLHFNRSLGADARRSLEAEIRARLLAIDDPETGRPLFSAVHSGREIYSGEMEKGAPDLVLDAYDSAWNIRTGKYTSHPGKPLAGYFYQGGAHRDFGWHSRDGIYVFAGPAFEPGADPGPGELADIAPTLLHIYGVPVPEDFDGRVMTGVLNAGLREREVRTQPALEHERRADSSYSADEAEALTEHLRSLGYLD